MNKKDIIYLSILVVVVLAGVLVYVGTTTWRNNKVSTKCLLEGEELGGSCVDCDKKKCCEGLVPTRKQDNGQASMPGSGNGWVCSVDADEVPVKNDINTDVCTPPVGAPPSWEAPYECLYR